VDFSNFRQSLASRYPHHLYVVALIASSGTLNVLALCVPFMQMKKYIYFEENYSLPRSVAMMWEQGYVFLAAIILAFSIVFPFFKLASLLVLWFWSFGSVGRQRLLGWLGYLGKWSMLDVFIVALLLVMSQGKVLFNIQPMVGLYLFVAAITLSMISSLILERLARHA
jgi:paraquat-inducible protein A